MFCDAVRYVTFMFWKLNVLELLRCVQLYFVTLRHVTFTLCCFTLCSNIFFFTWTGENALIRNFAIIHRIRNSFYNSQTCLTVSKATEKMEKILTIYWVGLRYSLAWHRSSNLLAIIRYCRFHSSVFYAIKRQRPSQPIRRFPNLLLSDHSIILIFILDITGILLP